MILPVSRKLSTNSNRNIKITLGLRKNPKKLYRTIPNTCLMSVTQISVYNIDRIVLGYARIYEPSTDAHTGVLIPVWDFFGSMTSESEYNGETESNTSKDPNESFLTINAVDGSIIDRDLGY